ncbi:MAG: CDP-6-deoxy-delta-3,4-glucoseen reductase [Sedimenticola sp.]|uniref:CDP-6-deoxy-delta-3,4-glucoseen reductase n=1 Tax=Sedimenticola thiotaurini TaxID=1543721 RepID=A0A558DFK9_9GAMM|nr:CDP-6-deoxy-delta-3,4-glucoseen reductase [Sedimenticola sp.]MCW8920421.1 CDP-6-deoxy-delta-3,4-glucoseen reductase [Sedimenticola sp.]MCW8950635.1 CDP-6-deoxy-delta-3,4-glucoseen reductase [Sedimenticola sp.]MDF1528325.1 CDP-6-deoxy-delta-3,4-glucoseen reductase [Sedimenticola sp.]TVT59811.1 MAG: CDP-6-deoxy-delta-3,4-glucoseen reductase [Sedimenticola thiotaurini]
MSFNVTVEPSGHTFTTERGESILEAADRQGVSLPYGCRNGACGSCASILVSGTVIYLDGDEELVCDKPEDYCLTCQAIPSSDITIRAHEVEDEEDEEIRTLVCSVEQMDKLSHDVMRVYLRLPENERLKYLAGQYLDFILEDGRRRAFSIANAPHDDELIELHIRHVPGGEFTDYVFDQMQVGNEQKIAAPMGGFFLREDSKRPMVFMAGGTGFAPLKAVIEHCFYIADRRPIHLYWGVRSKQDLYLGTLAEAWARAHPHLSFTPVLSEPDADWQGERGFVHEAVLRDHPDMSPFDLYMSGPPVMIFSARDAFVEAGLDANRMYSDVFEWAQDNPNK